MSLPIRRKQFDTQGFLAWLARNGVEIGKPSNPYEVVRYRAYHNQSKRPIVHIVYAKENGLLTWMEGTQGHYHAFKLGLTLTGQSPPYKPTFSHSGNTPDAPKPKKRPAKTVKTTGEMTRAKLLKRDGDECWFCGDPMGDDCTIEHLVPKSKGGRNMAANYALAHSKCNSDAADKPLVEKLEMRMAL